MQSAHFSWQWYFVATNNFVHIIGFPVCFFYYSQLLNSLLARSRTKEGENIENQSGKIDYKVGSQRSTDEFRRASTTRHYIYTRCMLFSAKMRLKYWYFGWYHRPLSVTCLRPNHIVYLFSGCTSLYWDQNGILLQLIG